MVESLTGYVARLAEAHSVSVGNLVGRVLSYWNPGAVFAEVVQHLRGNQLFGFQSQCLTNPGRLRADSREILLCKGSVPLAQVGGGDRAERAE
jgi:hypothetical protein